MKITSGDLRNIIRSEAKKASVINEQPGLSLRDALAKVMSALAREMYDQKGSRYEKADHTNKRLKAAIGDLKSILQRMKPAEARRAFDKERLLAPGMFSSYTPVPLRKTRDSNSLVDSFEAVSEILMASDEKAYPAIGQVVSKLGKSLKKYAPKSLMPSFDDAVISYEPEKIESLGLKIDVSKKRQRRGDAVKTVQLALANQGIKVEADGAYGPKTRAAIKKFQGMLGLKVDGIAGPNTLRKLAGRVERQAIARPLRQMIEAGIIVGARGGKGAKKAKPKAEPKAPEAPEEERGVGEDEEPGDDLRRPGRSRAAAGRGHRIVWDGKNWAVYGDVTIDVLSGERQSTDEFLKKVSADDPGLAVRARKASSGLKAPANESLKLTASNLRKIIREEIAKSVAASPVALTADQLRNLIISEAAKLGATDLLQEDLQSIIDTGRAVGRKRRRRSKAKPKKPKAQPKPGAGGGKPGDPAAPATPAEEEKEELMDELDIEDMAANVADNFLTNLELEDIYSRVTADEAGAAESALMGALRKIPQSQHGFFVNALEASVEELTGEDLYDQMDNSASGFFGGTMSQSPAAAQIRRLKRKLRAAKRGKLKIKESRTRVLAEASRRDQVKSIQQTLVKLGYDLGKFGPNKDGVDGDFGRKTEDAVKMFQRENGLEDDGVVGPITAAALIKATEKAKTADVTAKANAAAKAAEEKGMSAEENKAELESQARRAILQAEKLGAEVFGDRTGDDGAPLMFIIDRPDAELEAGANSVTADKLKDLMMKVFFGTSRMLDMKDIEVEILDPKKVDAAVRPAELKGKIRLTVTGPAREKGSGPLSDEEAAKLFESSQTPTRRVRLKRSRN